MPSSAEFAWPAYRALRLLALAQPLDDVEERQVQAAKAALCRCLDLPPRQAEIEARRCLLHRREVQLHEVMSAEMPATLLAQLVDCVDLPSPPDLHGRGTLFLSLHFGLDSSLLWLRLARVASAGAIPPLAVLFDSGTDRSWRFRGPDRFQELEDVGLMARDRAWKVDRQVKGPLGAARELLTHLQGGGAALMMFDAEEAVRESRHNLKLTIGRRRPSFPGGAAWLASSARARVIPAWIEPAGDGYAVRLGPAGEPHDLPALAQWLVEATSLAQPWLWEGWFRLPALAAEG